MSKDTEITSLDVNIKNLVQTDDDISIDELRLTTSDAMGDLSEDQLSDLKKRYKKITYTILDMEQNRKGFGLTENAMKMYVDHFHQTKDDSDLHGFYKDHDYKHIDSLMGRVVDTFYDAKNKRVRRTALIDMRHPTAQRLDMFKNLSTTIIHKEKLCSNCGAKFRHCDCRDSFPRSNQAVGIEDSLVTISGYRNAKRDSLDAFKDSLSLSAPELIADLEEEGVDEEEEEHEKELKDAIKDKDKLAPSSNDKEEDVHKSKDVSNGDADDDTEKTDTESDAKSEEDIQKEIEDLKETIELLKKIIERQE